MGKLESRLAAIEARRKTEPAPSRFDPSLVTDEEWDRMTEIFDRGPPFVYFTKAELDSMSEEECGKYLPELTDEELEFLEQVGVRKP